MTKEHFTVALGRWIFTVLAMAIVGFPAWAVLTAVLAGVVDYNLYKYARQKGWVY